MAVFKRGKWYHYEFILDGKRIQESAKTTSKTLALDAERRRRRELEQAALGVPVEQRADRIRSIGEMVKQYLGTYSVNHRPASVAFATGRLAHVIRLFGASLLTDLTEHEIRLYMKTRLSEGASGRTINAELGELSRAIGKSWKTLWPRVRKMEERKDAGKALSCEEEAAILKTIAEDQSPNRSRSLGAFVRIALLTGMRSGEIATLTWGQIDFEKRVLTVGRAKTSSGTGRQIPINQELFKTLASHAKWYTERFGAANADFYLFPYGKPTPSDPKRPTTTIKTAWNSLRRKAGVKCRLHDLRHTALTKLAEAGTPESTMLAIAGHMSRAMLERYSHIRMTAKREAVEALSIGHPPPVVPAKIPAKEAPTKIN
jgi:integrase